MYQHPNNIPVPQNHKNNRGLLIVLVVLLSLILIAVIYGDICLITILEGIGILAGKP